VGGGFTKIDGFPCLHLAALNATSGARLNWGPHGAASADLPRPCDSLKVSALVASRDRIVVAVHLGGFAGVDEYGAGGKHRWSVSADLDLYYKAGVDQHSPSVDALALDGQAVYVGGYFGSIGGARRGSAAALDLRTGAVESWKPRLGCPSEGWPAEVSTIAVGPTQVFLGGDIAYGRNLIVADQRTGKVSTLNSQVPSLNALALAGTASMPAARPCWPRSTLARASRCNGRHPRLPATSTPLPSPAARS
jgi:hypothetical protein